MAPKKPTTGKPAKTPGSTLAPDTLTKEELAARYGYALRVIYAEPELKALFEEAVNAKTGQWTAQKFTAELQNTNWWQNNNEYARKAFTAEKMGGADWEAQKENARNQVQNAARTLGAPLTTEELDNFSRRFLYEGWGESSRTALMAKALSERIKPAQEGKFLEGGAGDLEETLRALAIKNGLTFTPEYFSSAAASVASQLTTAGDWERDIRERAAGMFPVYKDKIMGGMDVRDLASPYMTVMEQELGISRDQVSLDDPYIRQALTAIDDKGNAVPQSLWDFQRKLRNDPRWMNGEKAQNEITSVAGQVMKMFGLMGG